MPLGSRYIPRNVSSDTEESDEDLSRRPLKRQKPSSSSSAAPFSSAPAPRSSQSSHAEPIVIDSDDDDDNEVDEVNSTPAQPEITYVSLGHIGIPGSVVCMET